MQTIEITQADINKGICRSTFSCAASLAVNRRFPGYLALVRSDNIWIMRPVDWFTINSEGRITILAGTYNGLPKEGVVEMDKSVVSMYNTPRELQEWIRQFDSDKKKCLPKTFTLEENKNIRKLEELCS